MAQHLYFLFHGHSRWLFNHVYPIRAFPPSRLLVVRFDPTDYAIHLRDPKGNLSDFSRGEFCRLSMDEGASIEDGEDKKIDA